MLAADAPLEPLHNTSMKERRAGVDTTLSTSCENITCDKVHQQKREKENMNHDDRRRGTEERRRETCWDAVHTQLEATAGAVLGPLLILSGCNTVSSCILLQVYDKQNKAEAVVDMSRL